MRVFYFLILSSLSLLFYSCSSGGNPEWTTKSINRIYSINIDGNDKKLLATGNDFSILENNKMIYINDDKLYLANSDGSNKEIISNNSNIYDYQLYLNNTKIIFKQLLYPNNSVNINLYTMNIDGSGLTELNIPNNINLHNEIIFSPDGSKIAFESNTGFYLMNSDGSDLLQLKDTTNRSYCYDISFTPNGKNVIYIHDIQYGVALDLRLYNIKIALDTSLFYNDDGNKVIAYAVSKWNTLLFSNGDGVNLENLNDYTHSFLYRGGDPHFSNDSTKITFMDYDLNAICVFDLINNSPDFIQVDLPKNYISNPTLSLDEKRVYFQADTSWQVLNKSNADNIVN